MNVMTDTPKHALAAEASDEPQSKQPKLSIPEEFLCSVCKEIMVDPGVLNCGHCICQSCYSDTLEPKRCPECREPASTHTVSIPMRNYLQKQFAESYKRQQQSLSDGWEIEYCYPNWRKDLRKLLKRLSDAFPTTHEECNAFTKGTSISLLLTCLSVDGCPVSRSLFQKNSIQDVNPLSAIVRKNGRLFFLFSNDDQLSGLMH